MSREVHRCYQVQGSVTKGEQLEAAQVSLEKKEAHLGPKKPPKKKDKDRSQNFTNTKCSRKKTCIYAMLKR